MNPWEEILKSATRQRVKDEFNFVLAIAESRIETLEKENRIRLIALEQIIAGTENRYPNQCLMDLEEINKCARAALEGK